MTRQTQALYEALPDIAKGYIEALLHHNGFWPEEQRAEIRKWESCGPHSFTVESYQSIADDCQSFLELLAPKLGGMQELRQRDFDWWDFGSSFYLCRMGSGHEPNLGADTIEDAFEAASDEMGEAYVEVGWWRRITHT